MATNPPSVTVTSTGCVRIEQPGTEWSVWLRPPHERLQVTLPDPVGLAEALADALDAEQRQHLLKYLQDDDSTDYCQRCERVTAWDGERCSDCARLWGDDVEQP